MKRQINEVDIKRLSIEEFDILNDWCASVGVTNLIPELNLIDLIQLNKSHPEFLMETDYWGNDKLKWLVHYHNGKTYTAWVESELFDALWDMTLHMIRKRL